MKASVCLKRCGRCCSLCCTLLLSMIGVAVATLVLYPYPPFPESGFPAALGDFNFTSRHVEVESGVKLFVVERPGEDESLPPVVFLHGIMDSWRSFQQLWPRLSTKRRFIAIDFRGHGDSDKPHASSYSLDLLMHDVDTVMKAMRVTKIGCFVGHSMGSLVAWRFAGTWPTRVERLVLIGTTPYVKPGFDAGTAIFKLIGAVLGGRESAPRWFSEFNVASSVTNTTDMGEVFFDTCSYQTMKWAPFMLSKFFAISGEALRPAVAEPIISSIEAETVVIAGEDDAVFPPPVTKPIMKLLNPKTKATMHVVPSEGHAVHWTKSGADFVAARIAEVFNDSPVSGIELSEQVPARSGIQATWMMSSFAVPLLALPVVLAGLLLARRMTRRALERGSCEAGTPLLQQ